jgi:hypothetical protein
MIPPIKRNIRYGTDYSITFREHYSETLELATV